MLGDHFEALVNKEELALNKMTALNYPNLIKMNNLAQQTSKILNRSKKVQTLYFLSNPTCQHRNFKKKSIKFF